MLKVVAKSVLLGVAVTVVAFAFVSGQVKKPPDPLAEWAYPKAKRGLEGTDQPPLIWAKLTTKDAFEKVWDFYWQKIARGIPQPKPNGGADDALWGTDFTRTCGLCLLPRPQSKSKVWYICKS